MGGKSEKGRVKSDCSARSSSLTRAPIAESFSRPRMDTDFASRCALAAVQMKTLGKQADTREFTMRESASSV